MKILNFFDTRFQHRFCIFLLIFDKTMHYFVAFCVATNNLTTIKCWQILFQRLSDKLYRYDLENPFFTGNGQEKGEK